MRRLILPIALATAVATLSGCGNKGPLFMPPPPAATATATPQAGAHPAPSASSVAPASVSTSRSPFNPLIHQ
ncbi:LPS translocon maturation chaperone LptM [Luteibacter sp. UNCMF366Tsu5.1]|uniref:LPS translocon maturation chaperone LptM n=1 Tax=Luteibacter sp. UNCMF366Tsu5.1 TaxID=1502758 RepID=UPI0009090DB5|nr:lipoprotein [Luteibacter sp. UNCMF366Tsu5.1]SFW68974.1 lipoprotein-attachment site-containing protein [Luteibacter sp. UNCMF366Tsu5.1]